MAILPIRTTIDVQPGQRFRPTDPTSWPLPTTELVIDRLVRDDLGMLHIVMIDLDGREISLFAEQFEAAVDSGYLVADAAPARAFA